MVEVCHYWWPTNWRAKNRRKQIHSRVITGKIEGLFVKKIILKKIILFYLKAQEEEEEEKSQQNQTQNTENVQKQDNDQNSWACKIECYRIKVFKVGSTGEPSNPKTGVSKDPKIQVCSNDEPS